MNNSSESMLHTVHRYTETYVNISSILTPGSIILMHAVHNTIRPIAVVKLELLVQEANSPTVQMPFSDLYLLTFTLS